MNYCKIKNSIISSPESLPNSFKNVIGGFDKLSNSELIKYGFYPYIQPEYDPIIQELDELIFITTTKTVTHSIKNRVFDFEAEKSKKINQAKRQANEILSKTDWYVTRKFERGIDIPENVSMARSMIVVRSNQIESEITAISNIREILNYKITF